MRTLVHLLGKIRRAGRSFGKHVRKHHIITISLSLLIVGGVALFIGLKFHKPIAAAINNVTNPEPPKERRAIDGVWVAKGMANPPLVAVMIENAADAQPLSGLDKASVIYEAIVEGTITRFMAVIALPSDITPDDERIGPVRSVRPYYVTWATELGAMLTHVGGSPAALERIRGQGILTLNEFYNGHYFHRIAERYAPHNTYTTTTDLIKAVQDKYVGSALERWSQTLPAWQFKDDAKLEDRGTTLKVRVGYAGAYAVNWEYNKEDNSYTRVQWGDIDKFSDEKIITAKNVAVVVQQIAVLDEIGRKQFTTEGTGMAYLFRDGTALVGTWQKDSPSARMRFYDQAGNEMSFNAGTTWLEIVPTTVKITY